MVRAVLRNSFPEVLGLVAARISLKTVLGELPLTTLTEYDLGTTFPLAAHCGSRTLIRGYPPFRGHIDSMHPNRSGQKIYRLIVAVELDISLAENDPNRLSLSIVRVEKIYSQ